MRKPGWRKVIALLMCIGFSYLTAVSFSHKFRSVYGGTARVDFAAIYYGARCVIDHQDPYNPEAFLKIFQAEGGTFSALEPGRSVGLIAVTRNVNLPTALFLVIPLAWLPYATAQSIWILLTIVLLVVASYQIWSAADGAGSVPCGLLIGIILANCQELLILGNLAGIAVSVCVLATWCFLKNRSVPMAIVLLALGLLFKPHDVGFVWLFFLLWGGVMRKRALQTLAITCVIGIAAAIWIAPVSPHWLDELRENHVVTSETGNINDPSPSGVTSGNPEAILDLQTLLSAVVHDPHSYNLASYLTIGSLMVVWMWAVIRRPMTADGAWLALAAIAVLSLLPVYHRPHDAKLLLLTIPACARLWSAGGVRRWLSFGLTTLAVLFTSDLFVGLLVCLTKKPPFGPVVPGEKAIALFLVPPAALLAMGCFYVWVFLREIRGESERYEADCVDPLIAV